MRTLDELGLSAGGGEGAGNGRGKQALQRDTTPNKSELPSAKTSDGPGLMSRSSACVLREECSGRSSLTPVTPKKVSQDLISFCRWDFSAACTASWFTGRKVCISLATAGSLSPALPALCASIPSRSKILMRFWSIFDGLHSHSFSCSSSNTLSSSGSCLWLPPAAGLLPLPRVTTLASAVGVLL